NPPGLSTAAGDPAIMGDEGGFRLLVGGGSKAIQWRGRSLGGEPKLTTINRPETGESLLILRGGLTLSIQDVNLQLPGGTTTGLGTISISADRLVAWTPLFTDLLNDPGKFNTSDGELYLEGDIVFKQGERTIYAQSMYYNVTAERGVILDAEAITPIPDYQGLVRLKADVIQQIAAGNFLAFDAAVTTSRMGLPRYWLQSGRLQLSQRATVTTDPNTNTPVAATEPYLESGNNFVYVAGVPVFAWPTFASPLRIPTFYLSDLDIRNDNILGTQVLLDWNLFQVLGIDDAPPGVEWTLSTDFLSERGPAVGTTLEYDLPGLFGVPGVARGQWDSWIIDDDGLDNLGSGRRDLAPEPSLRGRSLLRHRQVLPADYEFIAEVGWLSDRNFLEQYLENEWDRDVDHRTSLRLRRFFGANQFDLFVTPQVNEFFTTTQSLPELRHYLTGGSLLGDRLSYSMHNRAAYQKLEPADAPDDPSQTGSFTIAPGVANVDGAVASTRQEIGLPVSLGPIKVVPNVSGEATYFGEGLDGDDVTRLTGGGGVRASLPMWRADPNVQSALLNVDGLAHKVDWQFEYQYADSTTSVDEIPYYDSLDDNAQEEFRRRFTFDAFGGILPEEFEPRNHFLRQGYQSRIASPSHSTVDDMNLFRLGVHQRFQTRRGLRGSQRMVDLFELDIDTIVFADADRDNFGETIGPTTYDAAYRIGDRVSLLSDGYFDFFSDGLRSVALGVETSRPGLGDVYVGLLSLEGPLSSTVLRTLVNYRLNEKWIFSGSTVYDFGDAGNVGQTLALTRIGESFLIRLGVSVDEGRDNVGFRFAIEPRFWLRPKLGRLGGELIPPPGVTGIE
ncbi:MAG: organic solvent tolerance protein OstA, partial [Planctomycetota bacterium]